MPIDASIPLQGAQQAQPNLIQQATQAFTLKSAMQQSQQVEQTQKDQALLKQVLSDPAGFDVDQSTGIPIPKPETMQKLYGISPSAAQKLGESTMKLRADQQRQQQQKQQMAKAYADEAGPVLATLATEYEKALGTPEEKWAVIKPKMDAANAEFGQKAQQYGLPFKPIESAEQLQTKASAWSKYAERQMRATQPETPHEQRMGKASERRAAAAESAAAAKPVKTDHANILSDPANSNLSGKEFLAKIPSQDRQSVQALLDYDMDPKTIPQSKVTIGGEQMSRREYLIGLARKVNPSWSETSYREKTTALNEFQRTKGNAVRFLNVSIDHIDTAAEYAKALQNGDLPKLNQLKNWWQQETGQPAPNTFNGIKDIVASEVIKGAIGGPGGVEERKENAAKVKAANSPEQLADLFKGWTKLMAGQMRGLEKAYESGTGIKEGPKSFRQKYMLPRARQALEAVSNEPSGGTGGGGKRWVFDPATGALKPSEGTSGAIDPAKAVPE